MSDVNKIRLPDNTEVNIKDYRIPGVDTTPTSGSDNVITSGGVYNEITANSLVTSAALNDLNGRVEIIEDNLEFGENGEVSASKFVGPLEVSYEDEANNTSMYKSIGANKKVYTGVLGVANGSYPNNNAYANQSVYFLTIHPTSWDAEWGIKYKLNIHLDNESQLYKSSSTASTVSAGVYTRGIYDCNLNGTAGIYSTFHMFQSQKNTSYRPIYYHMLHSTTSAGFTAGYGHKIGVCFYSSYLSTPVTDYSSGSAVANTKYSRTIEVIVEEAINCTFELADTLEVEGDAYRNDYIKLNATYYTTNTSASNSAGRWNILSATTQGLYESGDDNTYTYTQQTYNYLINATKNGNTGLKLWAYPLIGFDKEGNALGISVYSSSQSSSTTTISAKGTRLYCTEGFDYTKGIRYVSTSSSFAYNANVNVSTQINYSCLDFRYSDNCIASDTANNLGLVNRKPVYLRGTIGNDGLFYLAPIDVTYNNSTYQRAWVQDIPSVQNEDGEYVYWFIGYPYYNSSYPNSLYQLNLYTSSELVWYKKGNVRPYIVDIELDSIPIENSTKPISSGGVYDAISEVEEVAAASLINLNERVLSLEDRNDVFCFDVVIDTSTATNNYMAGTSSATYDEICSEIDNGKAVIAKTHIAEDVYYLLNLISNNTNNELGFVISAGTNSMQLTINSENEVYLELTQVQTPGTLITNATTAQTASSGESMSGNITLHKVAKTGTYSDLIGKPTIPAAPGTLNTNNTTAQTANSSEALSGTINLHKVAKTGSYNDLLNKPTIPSAVTESTVSSWGFTKNTGTYSKPSTGIPASDLASGVIPTVPTISVNIQTDKASDVKTASPKAVYDEVHPVVASTQPQGGFLPNIFYKLGTITGSVTFALASPTDNTIVNHYFWTFETSTTAPTITWPSGISWIGGSAPTISASCHYEISIIDNIGVYMEV